MVHESKMACMGARAWAFERMGHDCVLTRVSNRLKSPRQRLWVHFESEKLKVILALTYTYQKIFFMCKYLSLGGVVLSAVRCSRRLSLGGERRLSFGGERRLCSGFLVGGVHRLCSSPVFPSVVLVGDVLLIHSSCTIDGRVTNVPTLNHVHLIGSNIDILNGPK